MSDCAGIDDLREIDQEMVDRLIKQRFKINKHGRPYKPGTIVRELIQPLTAVLNHAAARDYCNEPAFERPTYNDKRDRCGTDEECAAILKASAPHAAPIFLFDMYIGDRIGETIDLVIEDVFLDKAWAVLRDTKNGTNRGITLHQQIVELLRTVIGDRKTGAVFLTDDGLPYKTYPKTAWNEACRRAGVVNFRLHDLRHTFGTNADEADMTQRQREVQMGHCNGLVNARYVNVPDANLIAAINKIPYRDYDYHTEYHQWAQSGFGVAMADSPA